MEFRKIQVSSRVQKNSRLQKSSEKFKAPVEFRKFKAKVEFRKIQGSGGANLARWSSEKFKDQVS